MNQVYYTLFIYKGAKLKPKLICLDLDFRFTTHYLYI